MKKLLARTLDDFNNPYDPVEAEQKLEKSVRPIPIGEINWGDYPHKPDVSFRIAYSNNIIYLQFLVAESEFKAEVMETNGKVYNDSCVEFFFSPLDDGIYYNYEFNALGTCLLSAGKSRNNRIYAARKTVERIVTYGTMGKEPIPLISNYTVWKLLVAIPSETMWLHDIRTFHGLETRANFYKCGDGLNSRHYLTWERVTTDRPDFHRPEHFGRMVFL